MWYLAVAALSIVASATKLTHHGLFVSLEDAPYYIPPTPFATLNLTNPLHNLSSVGDLAPITVLNTPKTCDKNALVSTIHSFLEDDVFNVGFLQALIIQPREGSPSKCLSPKKTNLDIGIDLINHGPKLPVGPYFLSKSTSAIHIPYRLYSDTQQAFTSGVIPDRNGSFYDLPASIPGASTMTIGVPSRLYEKPTPHRPLAGVRLGIKDIYDIKGVKTGAGSRAYYGIYPPANKTAPSIQRLIDAGAVIIGKMKTAQFAQPEMTSNAIDYQPPFNPRGDGYQQPGSSSSGPATGMASYDWLDLALASDTGGSVRYPAGENGLYGNRPSHGLVDLSNVFSLAEEFDTPGFLARDPLLWRDAVRVLYGGILNYTAYPKSIQTFGIKDITDDSTAADRMISSFIDAVAKYLSANITTLNYTEKWEQTRPSNITSSLSDYLNTTWSLISAKEQASNVRNPFFERYASIYGREPYVNPVARAYWAWGDTFSDADLEGARLQQRVFSSWWAEKVNPYNHETCADSLIMYIGKNALGSTGQPAYREDESPVGIATGLQKGLFIAPLAGVVDAVVLIGQVQYNSTVTKNEEVLPVFVNIMAAHGCDGMVLDLIKDIVDGGLLHSVKVGNSIFGGGIFI